MISVDHFGLVNLIAGRRVVTELMQNDLNGEVLARELLNLLERDRNHQLRTELVMVAQQLGEGGASRLAAKTILELLEK